MRSLPDDEVHVWYAAPEALHAEGREAAARALLSTEEEERRQRYVFARDRRLYLTTRALVRTTLSLYADVAPSEWRFELGTHGRPEIARPLNMRALRFNLSNTSGLAVCAVARDREVGIDVEDLSRPAPLGVAERFFAPFELEVLRALPTDLQSRRFFEYWTLKESYIKARGLGLSLPVEQVGFHLAPGQAPRIILEPESGESPNSWRFVQLRPTPQHIVGLCVREHGGDDALTVVLQAKIF